MAMSPWLRFGLPLGSALLLVGILDTVIVCIYFLKEVGLIIYYAVVDQDPDPSEQLPEIIFLSTITILKLISTIAFLWIGGIFKGSFRMLQAWMVTTALYYLAISGNIIWETEIDHIPTLYIMLMFTITSLYQLIIVAACTNELKNQEILQPIGKGAVYIWEYFNNDLKCAAIFFLVSELVLDGHFLMTKEFLREIFGVELLGHDGDNFLPIVIEQLVLKCMRIILNAVGLAMVLREKRDAFRVWCIVSLVLVLISTILFVILTISWRGQDLMTTLAYFLLFPGHLLYRCIVLYFCLRYTRVNFSSMVL